jgi:hypothetical protein
MRRSTRIAPTALRGVLAMKTLTIATEANSKKGRSFQAALLGFIQADGLISFASTDDRYKVRPALLSVAATDSEMRAFLANLRSGRVAMTGQKHELKFELLRSAPYEFISQRTRFGTAVTAYLPDLFRHDPGMVDPARVQFVCAPPINRLQPESETAIEHVTRLGFDESRIRPLAGLAPIFSAYLDRRTRCPLVPDARFQLQLLVAALDVGLASLSRDPYSTRGEWGQASGFGYHEEGLSSLRLSPGVAFRATHSDLESFLSEQVSIFYGAVDAREIAA